jgi:DNA-binding transcriptional regulator YdaS (Cro superfamily)
LKDKKMNLNEYMQREKLTDEKMAQRIGVTRSAITHYRAGRRMPSPYTMFDIETATKGEVKWEDMRRRWMDVRKNISV